MDNKQIIVGLDIGTTKIDVIIGEVSENYDVRVVGVGTSPSDGLRKGVVVNIDATVKSIQKAVEEAELMAGIDVKEVYVGVAGKHIKSLTARGIVAVTSRGNEITHADVRRVIEQASTINLPTDREIVHVIPQGYAVDDQTGIKDPVGMNGVRLEGDVHIVTANTSSIQNIYKSVERAGIKVADIVLEPLASSYAVLEKDERELGVAVLDIGGGTTDLAIFIEDSIRYTNCLDLGGENVTNDVAMGISTPKERAEEIKKKWGACKISSLIRDEFVTVPGVAGREDKQVSKEFLAKIVRARMAEIFQLVAKDIQRTKLKEKLGAGLVLTGGSAMVSGACELAEEVFKMPVKLGIPKTTSGLTDTVGSPVHATGLGLVLYGVQKMKQDEVEFGSGGSKAQGFLEAMKKFASTLKNYI